MVFLISFLAADTPSLFYLHQGGHEWRHRELSVLLAAMSPMPSGGHVPLPGKPQSQESPNTSLPSGTLPPHPPPPRRTEPGLPLLPLTLTPTCPVPCPGKVAMSLPGAQSVFCICLPASRLPSPPHPPSARLEASEGGERTGPPTCHQVL